MISRKTKNEVKLMSIAGQIAGFALRQVVKEIKPGITTIELDKIAHRVIKARSGESAFLGYKGYKHTLCVSVNDHVVHGVPSSRQIESGDIVSIDLGVKYKGYFADTATSYIVGRASDDAKRVVAGVRSALKNSISIIKPGIKIGDIEFETGKTLKKYNLSPVMSLSGHGIGKSIHEEPAIKSDGTPETGSVLAEGMVLAIEPMATAGSGEVATDRDGWTVKTRDGSLAAHFEHTVLVTQKGSRILTGSL